MRSPPKRFIIWSAAAVLTVVVVAMVLPGLYTEAAWFRELGQGGVFWKTLSAEWLTGVAAAAIAGLLIVGSVEIALRRSTPTAWATLGTTWSAMRWAVRGAAVLAAIVMGVAFAEGWLEVQLLFASKPIGQTDPTFGRDLSFYLLELPAWHLLRSTLLVTIVLAAFGAGAVYVLAGRGQFPVATARHAFRHMAVLGGAVLATIGAGHLLDRWDLLYDGHGVAAGAGYTDLHARAPAYVVIAVAALIAAVAALYSAFTLRRRPAVAGFALYVLTVVVGSWIVPAAMQRFGVEPNELAREKSYIAHSLAGTRAAYGLQSVRSHAVDVDATPSAEAMETGRSTLDNVRLWDWKPLLSTYSQLQLIRSYYDFHDVDIDRYWLEDGELRQVMLSVRELEAGKLPESARTWVNVHLKYTHGYGLVASPVNRVTPEGLPDLWVKDIPPRSSVPALSLDEPAIYYGERTDVYAVVGASTPEFDFPSGDANRTTNYRGRGGVRLGGLLSRIAWSIRLGSSQLLLSGYVRPSTRILFRRNIVERVQALAPFLRYDGDPYPVVASGRLFWVIDAYTISRTYPYSESHRTGFNYIRNSVKAVVDAIDGTTRFYVNDPDDPVLAAYRRVFPSLFTPLRKMPDELRRHLRYPADLFQVQTERYAAYHMDDPEVFYNKEDLWQVPQGGGEEQRPMDPYYVTMQLPDGDRPEFLLILPFTPTNRDNMIAWLAARNDGQHRGELVEYILPKDRLVYGPTQVEARIDQDPQVSQLLTLWDQRGSQVLRGTLLVIPVGNIFLYVQPVYLQAERGRIPELTRVIVAAGDRIAMRETLEEALQAVISPTADRGEQPVATRETPPPPTASPEARAAEASAPPATPGTTPPTAPPSARPTALQHLESARAKLAAGDWAGYGAEMAALERILREQEGAQ